MKICRAEQALDHFWEEFNRHFVHTSQLDAALALATLEELTESTIEKEQTVEARQKVKTRKPAISNAQIESPSPASENVQVDTKHEPPKVKVKKKAYKAALPISAKLFGKPVTDQLSGKVLDEISGKIPWHQFITAMNKAGFGAENLPDSSWFFSS
ncbi:MAG: hypothetical protein Q9184_005708, partial [Pyrenodesmia sp. 2 TL-2023]